MDWIKRSFDSAGLTQYPVGKHLAALQARFGGAVILCLDVSSSMSGHTLPQAVEGCRRFVAEAVAGGYEVGGLLWNTGVAGFADLSRSGDGAVDLFNSARAGGGTHVLAALARCEQALEGRTGDRVIAIFGDGDLGDAAGAAREASRLAELGIRVLTVGLGDASAQQLGAISTEDTPPRVAQHDDIAGAIAGMAAGLKRR